jgi:hypothetical protein
MLFPPQSRRVPQTLSVTKLERSRRGEQFSVDSPTMNRTRALVISTVIIIIVVVFQLFFRYQYVGSGRDLMRVDRLTEASCFMPCALPTRAAPKIGKPALELIEIPGVPELRDERQDNLRAWDILRQNPAYETYADRARDAYWAPVGIYVGGPFDASGKLHSESDVHVYPYRLVCICNENNRGYWFEINIETGSAELVNDSANLAIKYDDSLDLSEDKTATTKGGCASIATPGPHETPDPYDAAMCGSPLKPVPARRQTATANARACT